MRARALGLELMEPAHSSSPSSSPSLSPSPSSSPPPWRDHLEGLGLFLFIPLVLFLFVAQPEPLAASFIAGCVLMIGHRLIARPYMHKVAPRLCLWTHQQLDPADAAGGIGEKTLSFTLMTGGGEQEARCLERHGVDVARFFTFLRRARPLLGAGIFLPLLALLGSLAYAAFGGEPPVSLEAVTAFFQLVVGLTVNVAAYGYLFVRRVDDALRVPFPAHNFFLLGIRPLLWIFRIMGAIWIARGLLGLFS